jgi:hypothetical protein
MNPIVLHLDLSTAWHLHFERDGKPVELEAAFKEGFTVRRDSQSARTMRRRS